MDNTNTKRKPRTYKISDDNYDKAMEVATKRKCHVSNGIENMLICFGSSLEIQVIRNGEVLPIDIFAMANSEVVETVNQFLSLSV